MASDVVAVRVYPPGFQFEPGNLRITATVPRHDNNRSLVILIDSENFTRSSSIQLDGSEAPITHQIEYRDLPAGTYIVVASVMDSRQDQRGFAITETRVLSKH
jgi:hypothetical protein